MTEHGHTTEELWEVARQIFHADDGDPGRFLVDVPVDQLPEMSEILMGMNQRRDEFIAELDETAGTPGEFSIIGVIGEHPWAYTVGLHPEHPGEILVRGFGAHNPDMISGFADAVRAGDFPLTVGVHPFGYGKVKVQEYTGDPADFGAANGFHRNRGLDDYPRFQIVVADDEGRFPGDPGCTLGIYQGV